MQRVTRFSMVAALLVGAGASLSAHADVILDSFTYYSPAHWPMQTMVTDPTLTTDTDADVGILGGQRTEGLGFSTMDVLGLDVAEARIYNQNGYSFMDYQSSVGAAATVELGYGQNTPLNLAGANAILIKFMGYDLSDGGPLQVTATVKHGSDPAVTYSQNVTTIGAHDFSLSLTGYAYSSVDSLVLDFVAPRGTDFRIDSVSMTVPEPASLALLGVALPLFLRRRRV